MPGYADDPSGEYPSSTIKARDLVLHILHLARHAKLDTEVDLLLSFSDSDTARLRVAHVVVSRADLFTFNFDTRVVSLTDRGRARANELFALSTHWTTGVAEEVFSLVYTALDGDGSATESGCSRIHRCSPRMWGWFGVQGRQQRAQA